MTPAALGITNCYSAQTVAPDPGLSCMVALLPLQDLAGWFVNGVHNAMLGDIAIIAFVFAFTWTALVPVPGSRALVSWSAAWSALAAVLIWAGSYRLLNGLGGGVRYGDEWPDWGLRIGIPLLSSTAGSAVPILLRSHYQEWFSLPPAVPGSVRQLLAALFVGFVVTDVNSRTIVTVGRVLASADYGSGRAGEVDTRWALYACTALLMLGAVPLLRAPWPRARRLYRVELLVAAISTIGISILAQAEALQLGAAWWLAALFPWRVALCLGCTTVGASLIVLYRAADESDAASWSLALVATAQACLLAYFGYARSELGRIELPRYKAELIVAHLADMLEFLLWGEALVMLLGVGLCVGVFIAHLAGAARPAVLPLSVGGTRDMRRRP